MSVERPEEKVIVVEDDAGLRGQMVAYLTLSGLNTTGVGSAAELYRHMAVEQYSIVILDLGLPDEDGLSIASHLRARGDVGIIMTTARGERADHINGFKAGADVYMPKPVDFEALVAAVKNLARRVKGTPAQPAPTADATWIFDSLAFTLTAPNGVVMSLTAKELALMNLFLRCRGAVAPRTELLVALGYPSHDLDNRSLDAAIRRLRLKVSEQAGLSLPVHTVHAVGYSFMGKITAPDC